MLYALSALVTVASAIAGPGPLDHLPGALDFGAAHPELYDFFSELKTRMDNDDDPGRFVLENRLDLPQKIQDRLTGRKPQQQQQTLKNKFGLQSIAEWMDKGAFTIGTNATVTVQGAMGNDDDAGAFYSVTGFAADEALNMEVSSSCGSFDYDSGWAYANPNDEDDTPEDMGWTGMVPSCVLKHACSGTYSGCTLYYYVVVTSDETCEFELTLSKMDSTCDMQTLGTGTHSITIADSSTPKWIEVDSAPTSGKIITIDWTAHGSYNYYTYYGSESTFGDFKVENFAVTNPYKAVLGFTTLSSETFDLVISESDYTCADGAAIKAANSEAFPLCTSVGKFVGYEAEPFEGLAGLFLLMLPKACYTPFLALTCVEMYPPCTPSNMAATLCSDKLCGGLVACAEMLSPGTTSGVSADDICAQNVNFNDESMFGEEGNNGTLTTYPQFAPSSTTTGCTAIPGCEETCGAAALKPALLLMAVMLFNTLKNLWD